MKRVFQHPPEPLTGKHYWRSLGELSDTPEFREWLEREFPAGTAELNGVEWSRRSFLKLMGASMALAGFGLNGCRRPEAHLVPFTKSAEWTIPGKFLYYATAMPRRTGAIPLIATTVDGRPIKLEGNPLHPASGGATDTFAQASILDLYDPSRSQRFVHKGKRLDRADVILALDSDFLDCGQGDLASVRAFTSRRRVSAAKDTMNRLYVVENRFTLTGAMADHRLRCPASQIALFAHALAGKILAATKDPGLGSVIANLQVPAGAVTFDDQWVSGAANDLAAKPGATMVLAGPDQPGAVQLLVYAINAALKNLGQTLVIRQVPRNPRTIDILQLAVDMNDGRIKRLFILGGDPVYNAQRGLAEDRETKFPLDWGDVQKKVPEIVRLGYHEDATSAVRNWHVPAA